MIMDQGWAKVQTWGISTPFYEMYSKYIAMLATPPLSKKADKLSLFLCHKTNNGKFKCKMNYDINANPVKFMKWDTLYYALGSRLPG